MDKKVIKEFDLNCTLLWAGTTAVVVVLHTQCLSNIYDKNIKTVFKKVIFGTRSENF